MMPEGKSEGLEFSVPYNTNEGTLDDIFKLKNVNGNRITEVFLSGPQDYSGSGRVMGKIGLDEFFRITDRIHSEGLKVNLVLNSVCEGADWYSSSSLKNLTGYIELAHREHDVESATIANPVIIKAVRKQFPNIEICASVLSDIDCVDRAIVFKDAGANIITPDANINRDLEMLKEIKRVTGTRIKLMVNEGCLYKCPFRKFHFNYVCHTSRKVGKEGGYFTPRCHREISKDPSQILKSTWIRPEDTRKYHDITSFFKIVGRALPRSKVIRTVKAYLEESWDGDLLDIVSSSLGRSALKYGTYVNNKAFDACDFFERVTSCGHKCQQCGFCDELADELVAVIGFTEEKMEDKGVGSLIDNLQQEGIFKDFGESQSEK